MLEAAITQPTSNIQSNGLRAARYYSSTAAGSRTGLVGITARNTASGNESIQVSIGALLRECLPNGGTGIGKSRKPFIITVDAKTLDRSIVSITQPATIEKDKPKAFSFKSQIDLVQNELGLPITQMAHLFGVTRKSVYDWLDGTEPRANISNRMELIASLIKENKSDVNLKCLKSVWAMQIEGRSFIDVLSDDSLDQIARLSAATAKLQELAPRLGQDGPKLGKTYLGNAHSSDIDRVADLG